MRSQGQAKLKTFTLNSIILNAGPQRRPRADANGHCDGRSPTDNDSIQLRRPASRVSGARQVPFSVVSYGTQFTMEFGAALGPVSRPATRRTEKGG